MSAPKPTVREWYVGRALDSFQSLLEVLMELTADEVIAALELESQSRRRRAIVDRLVSRAIRLNEISYAAQLKEKYRWDVPPQQ
jgi:hypothetical protein